MIKYLKNFFVIWKKSINYKKYNNLYYSSQIITSCAIPDFKIRKKIWLLKFFNKDDKEFEYYWFENEEEIKDVIKVLKNFGYYFIVKQYDIDI